MFQTAMSQQAGDCFDICAVIQDIDGKRMSGAMPADMLVYSGSFHPTPYRLATTFVRRQNEYGNIQIAIFRRITYQRQ